jgi:hypothetical protein
MTTDYTAYDYTAQKWITGPSAKAMLIEQAHEDLALLNGDGGEAYAKAVGSDRDDMLKRVCQRLEGLTGFNHDA